MKRVHLIISGYVQGIGFRAWFARSARQLQVTGWVKNREDGTVEAVCDGPPEELKKILEVARTGPETSWVDDVVIEWLEPSELFHEFKIM